ncbi:hypothetical protein BC941DRAFT_409423 [Chlamydoabsidia padenii]|nr:hypothetical protein BC941DRAFT_409423 [Chlamydoabsidia padenii]
MTQSVDIGLHETSSSPKHVHGWLLGVRGYESSQEEQPTNVIPDGYLQRRGSSASEDSVDLEELIKANYTLNVDDETDLLDLATLDLDDDAKEDFWRMDKEIFNHRSTVDNYTHDIYINDQHFFDSPELSWSPPQDRQLYSSLQRRTPSPLSNSSSSSQTSSTGTVKRLSRLPTKRASHIPSPTSRLFTIPSSKSAGIGTPSSRKQDTRSSPMHSAFAHNATSTRTKADPRRAKGTRNSSRIGVRKL